MLRIHIDVEKRRKLQAILSKYSNYEEFSANKKDAYAYTELLGVIVCPYCNLSYIHTVKDVVRPDIDHFEAKKAVPGKSLNVANLIPACLPCNMRIKGRKKFRKKTHLYPLRDSLDEIKRFSLDIKSPALRRLEDFSIQMVNISTDKRTLGRADESIRALRIVERYQLHKPEVLEILNKARFYHSRKISELERLTETSQLRRWLFDDLYRPVELRPLGKLRKDITVAVL